MLRGFISSVDFKGLDLDPKRIGIHSLRLSAAMAMYLNGVPVYTIMLLGCWSRDAFLRYIRKQVESFGSSVSSKMIVTSRFLHVSHSTDLEDPRTSLNPASFPANMGMGSGGNINRKAFSVWADWPPQSHSPAQRQRQRLVPPKQDQVSHRLTGTA